VGGATDSLLQFKLRFDAGALRGAAIGKQIHDTDVYRDLTGTNDADGFFPRYRRSH